MAVLSIKEGFSGVESGGDETGRTAVRVFSIVTDSGDDGPIFNWPISDPTTGLAIPAPNTGHPDLSSFKSLVPRVTKVCPCYFNVHVGYSTRPPEGFPAGYYDDPLTEPAHISWSNVSSVEAIDRDINGNRMTNTAGVTFKQLVEEFRDPLLTIVRNEPTYDPDTELTYSDTVCSTVFWGGEIGRAKMNDILAEQVHSDPIYWRVRYQIQFRMKTASGVPAEEAWYQHPLNEGRRCRDSSGLLVAVKDDLARPTTELKLLAQDGSQLGSGLDPIWLSYQTRFFLDWGPLGINNV